MIDDKRWFAEHRGRSYRVRAVAPGEAPFDTAPPPPFRGMRPVVAVHQILPGMRRRRLAYAPKEQPLDGASEGQAAAVYESAQSGFLVVSPSSTRT
jgi:hypothetical protein